MKVINKLQNKKQNLISHEETRLILANELKEFALSLGLEFKIYFLTRVFCLNKIFWI